MKRLILSLALLSCAAGALPTAALAAGGEVMPLYPKGVIKASKVPEAESAPFPGGGNMLMNVSVPTLELFRPAAGKATGAAVIVAPGGGFFALSYDNEGTAVARRLADEGVTAFVLKYRLAPMPTDPAQRQAQIGKALGPMFARAASTAPSELARIPGEELAAADAAQAVKLVRAQATKWAVDPKRIGFIGFSAGAFTAANVAIGDSGARPDFVGLIYGGLRTPVPKDAPPAFIVTAADDQLLPNDGVLLYQAWRKAGRPAELHQYERGGHGFGMKTSGAPTDHWFQTFLWWLEARGLLKK